MSQYTRDVIKDAISQMIEGSYRIERVRLALYLVMISPDYAIMK